MGSLYSGIINPKNLKFQVHKVLMGISHISTIIFYLFFMHNIIKLILIKITFL